MAAGEYESNQARHDWRRAIARADLGENGVALVRIGGRQIAVFETGQGIRSRSRGMRPVPPSPFISLSYCVARCRR